MNNIYKIRLIGDTIGDLHAVMIDNKQIPDCLKLVLSKSIYEALDEFKGDRRWRETYYKFTDKETGIRYEQFGEDTGNPCKNCTFWLSSKCNHPYYDIKGICTKPYKIEK